MEEHFSKNFSSKNGGQSQINHLIYLQKETQGQHLEPQQLSKAVQRTKQYHVGPTGI